MKKQKIYIGKNKLGKVSHLTLPRLLRDNWWVQWKRKSEMTDLKIQMNSSSGASFATRTDEMKESYRLYELHLMARRKAIAKNYQIGNIKDVYPIPEWTPVKQKELESA